MNNDDIGFWWLFGFFVFLILLAFIVKLAQFITEFSRELRYLENEIRRTDGEERRYWMHRKRRLWLSLIPFFKY